MRTTEEQFRQLLRGAVPTVWQMEKVGTPLPRIMERVALTLFERSEVETPVAVAIRYQMANLETAHVFDFIPERAPRLDFSETKPA
jgi:hypothetical protein